MRFFRTRSLQLAVDALVVALALVLAYIRSELASLVPEFAPPPPPGTAEAQLARTASGRLVALATTDEATVTT